MTDNHGDLLLQEIAPRLRHGIAAHVPVVGSDDPEELFQDGLNLAARMLARLTRAGKKVTAGNVAYYVILHLRIGRRSTGSHRSDALHPAAQMCGRSRVHSMDAPVNEDGDISEEPLTLHDCLAAPVDDPAVSAARHLDWQSLLAALDQTAREILVALIAGTDLTALVSRLRRSRSAIQTDKVRLIRLIQDHLGEDILAQIQSRPAWTNNLLASRSRLVCRAAQRAMC